MPRNSLLLLLDRDSDTGHSINNGCRAAGWDVTCRWRDEPGSWQGEIPEYHSLLVYGPHNGSVWPLAERLMELSRQDRPRVIWWLCENSPKVTTPRLINRILATAAWSINRTREKLPEPLATAAPWRQMSLGHRHQVLSELLAYHRHRLVDRLVVTSRRRAVYLNRMGLHAIHVPLGYDPIYGVDLQYERVVDVLYLGKLSGRRRRVWERLALSLQRLGVRTQVIDGRTSSVVNESRTALLNRTRILINLLQSPADWTGHRLLLGMANGALVVSEPLLDSGPFVPGTHLIEAPLHNLVDTIRHYLLDEESRCRITTQAREFVQCELAMPSLCARVLASTNESLTP